LPKASSDKPIEFAGRASPADELIRRLSGRYFLVLLAVAALVIADQAIVQPLLVRMNCYAPAINLAGRQRMLSQRLTKAALALEVASDNTSRERYRSELRMTLTQWSSAHAALRRGDEQLGLLKLDSPQFNAAWNDLEPHSQAMQSAGNQLAEAPADSTSPESVRTVAVIVDHEAAYLPVMERIVSLLEHDADRQVVRLRAVALSIAATIFALLVGLGWYVVRPATGVIRAQFDRLGSQVASRTHQLAIANESLTHEMIERQEAESKNRALAAQLAHAARISTMGQFTAALAHEINQPLAAIANDAATCELELQDRDPATHDKLLGHVEHIKQAALRAGQIVRRIRNFVRPNVRMPAVEADLNALVQEVVALVRFEAQRDGIAIVLDLTARNANVLVDPIQIQQVLVNLLQNAFQALRECPRDQRRIEIQARLADGTVLVRVHDFGPGLSLDPDLLFMPFTTTKPDGLGIGLSICRSIIEGHHGQIWMDRLAAQGTTICFSLPQIPEQHARSSQPLDSVCR
jgi:two-component system, LuxR family, sensor kinase FixL